MKPKIYSTAEVAEIFKVSDATIRNEVKKGNLPCFKVGNEAKFTQHHIDYYMNLKNFGKTAREMELEEENEELLRVIESKEKVIDNIKNLILKGAV